MGAPHAGDTQVMCWSRLAIPALYHPAMSTLYHLLLAVNAVLQSVGVLMVVWAADASRCAHTQLQVSP
jgi:hypothetical protein